VNKFISALTHFLPRFINKRLQYWGERRRSAKAALEPETNLPFPYNNALYLEAYCLNKKFAEPDFEAYWQNEQRWVYVSNMYSKSLLLRGYRAS
jgi:hypothetical protein